MKQTLTWVLGLAVFFGLSTQAEAFTSKDKDVLGITAGGTVTGVATLDVNVVAQGSGSPGTSATLGFGTGGNAFRDSDEALEIFVNSNEALNSVIIYTDNLGESASPKFTANTALGNDGGGLVGVTDTELSVPILWALNDDNPDHAFTTGTIGDDEVFLTDRAHVATFTAPSSQMDDLDLVKCDAGASLPVAINNTDGDELYSQYFGTEGQNQDMCLAPGQGPVTLFGQGPGGGDIVGVNDGDKVPAAEELSKNISVIAFGFLGIEGAAIIGGTFTEVTSPIYVAIGADFSTAAAQAYETNTLTVELITQ